MKVQYYITDSGKKPVKEWQDGLDIQTKSRIDAKIAGLRLGNTSNCKPVGGGVHELVIDFGPGYRIYYGIRNEKLVMLLCAGTKKNQQSTIDEAKENWANYKSRIAKSKEKLK